MSEVSSSTENIIRRLPEPKSILLGFALLQVLVLYVYEAWIEEYMMHARFVGTRDSLILLMAAAALRLGKPWAYFVAILTSGFMAIELYHRMVGYWGFTLAHIPQHIIQFAFGVIIFCYAGSCMLFRGVDKRSLP